MSCIRRFISTVNEHMSVYRHAIIAKNMSGNFVVENGMTVPLLFSAAHHCVYRHTHTHTQYIHHLYNLNVW
jgi:hypothetical protein